MKRSDRTSNLCGLTACAALVMAVSVVCASADATPLQILHRSISARTSVSFSGTRTVVLFDDGVKVRGVQQRVYCKAPDKMRIELLAPSPERGKLSLTNGRVHWEYHPQRGRALRGHQPAPSELVKQRLQELKKIAQRMHLQYCGRETIAGREAHVIKVYSAEGVPVKKSYVDTERYVTLKTQRFDAHGNVKSSAYYTQITYDPAFPPGLFDFEPPPDCSIVDSPRPSRRMSLTSAQQQVGFDAALPSYLPPGYVFHEDRVAVIEINKRKALWLTFSNGVETFSLFQRRACGPSDVRHRGRSVTWTSGDYCFTLMGALGRDEMRKVRSSISP